MRLDRVYALLRPNHSGTRPPAQPVTWNVTGTGGTFPVARRDGRGQRA